jgi:hypothetical protein
MTRAQVSERECASLRHPGQMRIVANLDLFHLDFSPVALIIYIKVTAHRPCATFGSTLCKTRDYTTPVHWELNPP